MKKEILEHYLQTGTYTYAGAYQDYFRSLPDENFDRLVSIWNTKKKFRIMNSPLVGDYDNEVLYKQSCPSLLPIV